MSEFNVMRWIKMVDEVRELVELSRQQLDLIRQHVQVLESSSRNSQETRMTVNEISAFLDKWTLI